MAGFPDDPLDSPAPVTSGDEVELPCPNETELENLLTNGSDEPMALGDPLLVNGCVIIIPVLDFVRRDRIIDFAKEVDGAWQFLGHDKFYSDDWSMPMQEREEFPLLPDQEPYNDGTWTIAPAGSETFVQASRNLTFSMPDAPAPVVEILDAAPFGSQAGTVFCDYDVSCPDGAGTLWLHQTEDPAKWYPGINKDYHWIAMCSREPTYLHKRYVLTELPGGVWELVLISETRPTYYAETSGHTDPPHAVVYQTSVIMGIALLSKSYCEFVPPGIIPQLTGLGLIGVLPLLGAANAAAAAAAASGGGGGAAGGRKSKRKLG